MKLAIRPSHKSTYPLRGILIKNVSALAWLKEIQLLNIDVSEARIYPLPGIVANSVWGCLIISPRRIDVQKIGKHEACQQVHSNLFIPEKTALYPAITANELEKLFFSAPHVFHPEFGLAELTEELKPEELLTLPLKKNIGVSIPQKSIFIPTQIKSFQVYSPSPEEILKDLEDNIFPEKEFPDQKEMPDNDALSISERAKLEFYRILLGRNLVEAAKPGGILKPDKLGVFGVVMSIGAGMAFIGLGRLFSAMFKLLVPSQDTIDNYKDLEERNKNKFDKLIDLLKNNPEEGLKYAIPLDNEGTSRGGSGGDFQLSKRWLDFSLFGNSGRNSGRGTSAGEDAFFILQKQYRETADELIRQKEYLKAAFIYMKLLKDYHGAARVLEEGKLYKEAAIIYLKHINNKLKAAECYEKGNMINNAIELYIELNENEKAGDLYLSINKRKEAEIYFQKVADAHKSNNQFVKASLIYKYKMQQPEIGQDLLLQGWRLGADAFNCLNNYFSNIKDIKELKQNIGTIYKNEVWSKNKELFLQVIDYEYAKKNELADYIKEMAYEIIADQVEKNPAIVSELKKYNPDDKELMKDTIRYLRTKRINKN